MRVSFDLESESGIRKYGEFVERAADLVVSYGGSLSGEHGDGQSRGALLPKMYGPELVKAFGEFKSVWDPDNRMNPNKVVNAYLPTENLRLGADYNPQRPKTYFHFPDDGGSMAKATVRCVGLGECRKTHAGAMCPSYMVTLEEQHSTRGRAHMLFELLQGEIVRDSWRDEHVKKALDLCLSCKACKSECPTNVDIATYRAEFLSHYYESKSRPLHAHFFGRIDRWARLGKPALALVYDRGIKFAAIDEDRRSPVQEHERDHRRSEARIHRYIVVGELGEIAPEQDAGCQPQNERHDDPGRDVGKRPLPGREPFVRNHQCDRDDDAGDAIAPIGELLLELG